MRLTDNEIEFISRKIVKTLVAEGKLEVDYRARVIGGIMQVITDELRVEDRLNEEVRETLLRAHPADGALRHHLLGDVQQGKHKLAKKKGIIL